jgi:hypothetical protein
MIRNIEIDSIWKKQWWCNIRYYPGFAWRDWEKNEKPQVCKSKVKALNTLFSNQQN